MPKSWIPKSDFVRRFFLNCSMHARELHAKVMDPKLRFCSYSSSFFFFSELSQCIQGNSMPESWIPKSDFVMRFFLNCSMHPRELHAKVMDPKLRFCSYSISFFSFLNCLNASRGTPCQSHGSQNQILFVFHFVFSDLLNASKGTPCQSHGSRNQILFVLHLVFL